MFSYNSHTHPTDPNHPDLCMDCGRSTKRSQRTCQGSSAYKFQPQGQSKVESPHKDMKINCLSFALTDSHRASLAAIVIMLAYAGNALFSKAGLSNGMSPFVFVAYRQAFACVAFAPLAYFFERNAPALSFPLLGKIFLLSLSGITTSLELYYEGIIYTSATFAAACTNALPSITFVLAILFRMESVSLAKVHGCAKLFGSVIGLCGAMVFAFLKGPPLRLMSWNQDNYGEVSATSSSTGEWAKGALMMLGANTCWSLWLILQGPIMKQYPAKLRLTALQCFFSCIQAAFCAIAVNRNLSSWKLGWDVNLFSVAYCGVIGTGMTYWLQVWVIEKKGPVFVACFTPLSLVLTAIISPFFWKETLFWGRIGGSALLVAGQYIMIWGKYRETSATPQTSDEEKQKQGEYKEDTTLTSI